MGESSPNTPGRDASSPEVLALRYYNDALLALDLLYESAIASPGAIEELHAEAERLLQRGAQWRDLIYKDTK